MHANKYYLSFGWAPARSTFDEKSVVLVVWRVPTHESFLIVQSIESDQGCSCHSMSLCLLQELHPKRSANTNSFCIVCVQLNRKAKMSCLVWRIFPKNLNKNILFEFFICILDDPSRLIDCHGKSSFGPSLNPSSCLWERPSPTRFSSYCWTLQSRNLGLSRTSYGTPRRAFLAPKTFGSWSYNQLWSWDWSVWEWYRIGILSEGTSPPYASSKLWGIWSYRLWWHRCSVWGAYTSSSRLLFGAILILSSSWVGSNGQMEGIDYVVESFRSELFVLCCFWDFEPLDSTWERITWSSWLSDLRTPWASPNGGLSWICPHNPTGSTLGAPFQLEMGTLWDTANPVPPTLHCWDHLDELYCPPTPLWTSSVLET